MAVQKLVKGSRHILKSKSDSLEKTNIGIRFKSESMDIHTVIDIAIVCKSKTKGIYTIWYGNPQDEQKSICDETIHCNGSSWNDDDLRISIDFSKVAEDIERMAIITNILWGKDLNLHYGCLEQGYLHIYDDTEKIDIIEQYIKCQEHKDDTGMIWSEIYPYKGSWKIRAIEQSFASKDLGELAQIAGRYL